MPPISPDLQALSDRRYENGMLASTVKHIETDITEMKGCIVQHQTWIDQFKGSISIMKWLIGALCTATGIQVFMTVSKILGG